MESYHCFVSKWVSTIAIIECNDFWFYHSSRLAKEYILEAQNELIWVQDIFLRKKLSTIIQEVSKDCDFILWREKQLLAFQSKKRNGVIEKIAKFLTLISLDSQLSMNHRKIVLNLKYFHSEITQILNWKNEPY